MQLSFNYHPQFIAENLKSLWELFIDDQTFRFLEMRKRLRFELKLTLDSEKLPNGVTTALQKARQALGEADEDLSWIEQSLLSESHERWRLALFLLGLEKSLRQAPKQDDPFIQAAHLRLNEIYEKLQNLDLPEDPSWLKILKFRWFLEPLRKEGLYLCKILDQNT